MGVREEEPASDTSIISLKKGKARDMMPNFGRFVDLGWKEERILLCCHFVGKYMARSFNWKELFVKFGKS